MKRDPFSEDFDNESDHEANYRQKSQAEIKNRRHSKSLRRAVQPKRFDGIHRRRGKKMAW